MTPVGASLNELENAKMESVCQELKRSKSGLIKFLIEQEYEKLQELNGKS